MTYLLIILFLLWIGLYLHRSKKSEKKIVHVIDANCARCGNCIRKCRHHILEMVKSETGMHIEVKHPDKCSGCGDCVSSCHFDALELIKRI